MREREREREERKREYYFVICIGSQTKKFILTIRRRRGEKIDRKKYQFSPIFVDNI